MHELGIIIHISKTLKEVAEENEVKNEQLVLNGKLEVLSK